MTEVLTAFTKPVHKAGAQCRESDMIEVSKKQPRIAARKGCGGQRDAGPDSPYRSVRAPVARLNCGGEYVKIGWDDLSGGKELYN